ncbi:hypothetical protein [Sphingomonas sp.]|jgi:hypothetical protein|uniref:hypothetical protein n=1 Tax=Sphingomonas sp. TaxID=28214 RepID=UPI002D7F448A|nr:hypothetical protein [Sphingomonas sp.]HEU0045323.1 hypothetical protein [Sphingomonas sp.]
MTDSSDPRPAPGTALAATDTADTVPDYNPDDYRWVPVRRRRRVDGWTEEKQRRFIEILADTGLVGHAAKAVGMTRESAYRLRRAPHAGAFARAWDAARQHAGGLIEDIAFERAIEGVEQDVYDGNGNVVAAKLVHDNRLLRYLLSRLKPERYGTIATGATTAPPPALALEQSLRAMEPALPAPPEQLLGCAELAHELDLADRCDGELPHFLREQRPLRTDAQVAADAAAARSARGAAALARQEQGHTLTEEEFADMCFHLDPVGNAGRRRRSRDDAGSVNLV